MTKLRALFGALAFGLVAFFFLRGGGEQAGERELLSEEVAATSEGGSVDRSASRIRGNENVKENKKTKEKFKVIPLVLESAEAFGQPGNTARENMEYLTSLISEYDSIVKEESIPTGVNEDFVDALTGRNSERIEVLPRDHPRIDKEGRLLDNWASPYFFHSDSETAFQIRSAGPDKEMFTEDDILETFGS